MEPFLKYAISAGADAILLDGSFACSKGITNPSIYPHNGALRLSLRSCEYTFINYRFGCIQNNQNISWYPLYIYPEVPVNFTSDEYICSLDADTLELTDSKRVLECSSRDFVYNGAEDIRLFELDGNLAAAYSSFESDERVSMNISEFDRDLSVLRTEKYNIEKYEKNWMPVIGREGCYVRKAFGDIIDIRDGSVSHTGDSAAALDDRGSTQMWPYGDGYIGIVHKNYLYRENGFVGMQYSHKFVVTDKNLIPVKESAWFVFVGASIEFTCGMYVSGDELILPFSVFDSAVFVLRMSMRDVMRFIDSGPGKLAYGPSKNELHDIAATKNGDEFIMEIEKYIIRECPGNAAAKIACFTHIGKLSKNVMLAKEMYVKALCEIKKFGIGMGNAYMQMLVGQDLIRDTINRFYD